MTVEFFSDETPVSGPNTQVSATTHFAGGAPETFPERGEPAVRSARDQQMLEVAGRIGDVLGTAVRHARGFSGRVRGGLHLVQDMAGRVAHVPQGTSEAASRLKQTATEQVAGWSEEAKHKAVELRRQAEELKTEYPLQMIIGLAVLSFTIGFGIRFWRSIRA